jgi:hypothetical protein
MTHNLVTLFFSENSFIVSMAIQQILTKKTMQEILRWYKKCQDTKKSRRHILLAIPEINNILHRKLQ